MEDGFEWSENGARWPLWGNSDNNMTQVPRYVFGNGGDSPDVNKVEFWASLSGCEVLGMPGNLSGYQPPSL